ncbi:MAG TPA: hypothetical protein VKA46_00730 [Gemmataceae bacterium]|nr:hypothetical protein [Gemmataceae bacterium]
MHFRYKLISTPYPVISLGGRFVRPRPLVDVSVIGRHGTRIRQALLDSGADDTVFDAALAAVIGVDLTNAATVSVNLAAAGGMIPVRYAPVMLRLTDGREMREWPATIGFTSARLVYPLLGFAGCLQFFDAKFRGDVEIVELTTNALYPGT